MEKKGSVFDESDIILIISVVVVCLLLMAYYIGYSSAVDEGLVKAVDYLECDRIKEDYEALKKTIEIYGIEEN